MNQEVSRSPDVCGWLVRQAAQRAPLELRERLEEEWLADLGERGGHLSRVRFALGCLWATQILVAERPARLAAAGAHGRILAGSAEQLAGLSRRTSSLALVIALHVAVFYACWVSLASTHRSMTPAPLKNIVLERKPTPAEHLPPVRPRFAPLPLPTPENPGLPVIDAGPDTIVGETHADGLPLVPTDTRPRPHSVTRVTGGPAAGFPNVDDFYPSVSVRANEQGGAAVQVCVDTRGRLTGEPSIVHSSGYANLDGAALKLAKAGSGHYRPSTEDGAAVASCFAYIARFRLKN